MIWSELHCLLHQHLGLSQCEQVSPLVPGQITAGGSVFISSDGNVTPEWTY